MDEEQLAYLFPESYPDGDDDEHDELTIVSQNNPQIYWENEGLRPAQKENYYYGSN